MKRLLAPLTAVLVFAASCTGGAPKQVGQLPSGASGIASAPIAPGGTLRVVIPRHPVSTLARVPALDPQTDWWSDSFEVFRCCLLRTLLANRGLRTDQGGAQLHPDLAAAMPEVSIDGLTWTFHLKRGINYAPPLQDTPVVAADIIRALEREAVRASPGTYAFYYSAIQGFDEMVKGHAGSISGLEAPDDSTLVVRLSHAEGDLGNLFAMPATAPIPPNPEAPSARLGAAQGLKVYGPYLVATGPYMIEGSQDLDLSAPPRDRAPISGYVPGRSLTLVRNPSWQRVSDPLRPAYADRIEFTIGGSIENAVALIRSGKTDLYLFDDPAPQIPVSVVERFQTHPELGVRVYVETRDLVRYVNINLAVPPLDDLHVRKAISYAIDKKAMLDLRGGPIIGEAADHIVLDSLEGGLLGSYDPYPTSLQAARAEMARSEYDQDGDGRCDQQVCNGLVMLSSRGYSPVPMSELAARVKRDLEAIGIDLRIETPPFSRAVSELYDPRAKVPLAIFSAWGKDFLNASSFIPPLFSSEAIGSNNSSLVGAAPSQLLRWGYHVRSVPSIDNKIDQCFALVGENQTHCWAQADQLLMEKVIPCVPYVFENKVQLVGDRVTAYSFDQFSISPAIDRIAVSIGSA